MTRSYRDSSAPKRAAGSAPLTGSPARFGPNASGASYPAKYLPALGPRQRTGSHASGNRPATIPLSLLFPIFVLLMLTISMPEGGGSQEIDAQLIVRMVAYGLAATAVLFALGKRKLRLNLRMLPWLLIPVFITATALYAPDPLVAFTAGLAHLALLLFAWRLVIRHGQSRAVLVIVITGMIVGALSILAYYGFPDIGRSAAQASYADPGGRMRGITGQPNTLGVISAVTILLAMMYFRTFTARQQVLAIGAIAIAAFCVVYSESRTTIVALALCLLLWRLCRANPAFNLFAVVGFALAACLVIAFVPDVADYLSRDGARSDDLVSLNGRSGIWTVAWEGIKAHPLLGQGYGASRELLRFDDRLFAAAVNTHNVYLELLFSGGVVLLGLFVFAATVTIVRSATQRRLEALLLLIFFLIRGTAESAPFSGLPLFPVFVYYTAISMCLFPLAVNPQARGRNRAGQSAASR